MMRKKITYISIFIASIVIFFGVRPVLARVTEKNERLINYLADNDVGVGVESVDGYSIVYYVFENKKTYVSEKGMNASQVSSAGEYLVWSGLVNGAGQIFKYHIPTGDTIQITSSSTNLKPTVDVEGRVAWERWVDEGWQIFVFDELGTRQISSGDVSVNAQIEGGKLVFARKGEFGWRAVTYTLGGDRLVIINEGIDSKYPDWQNGKVIFRASKDGS